LAQPQASLERPLVEHLADRIRQPGDRAHAVAHPGDPRPVERQPVAKRRRQAGGPLVRQVLGVRPQHLVSALGQQLREPRQRGVLSVSARGRERARTALGGRADLGDGPRSDGHAERVASLAELNLWNSTSQFRGLKPPRQTSATAHASFGAKAPHLNTWRIQNSLNPPTAPPSPAAGSRTPRSSPTWESGSTSWNRTTPSSPCRSPTPSRRWVTSSTAARSAPWSTPQPPRPRGRAPRSRSAPAARPWASRSTS